MNFEISEPIRQQLLGKRKRIKEIQTFAAEIMKRLTELQTPFAKQIDLLMTIPGIKETAARLISLIDDADSVLNE